MRSDMAVIVDGRVGRSRSRIGSRSRLGPFSRVRRCPPTANASGESAVTRCRPGGATPSSASSSTGHPASVAAFAPVDVEIGELMARNEPHAMAWSPYAEWYENSLRFPESPVGAAPRRGLRRPALPRVRRRLGGGARPAGIPTSGRPGSPPPAPATSCSSPSTTTATASGRPTSPTRTGPGSTAPATWSASWPTRCGAVGLRFGVYYSGGLDWTFNDHPIGTLQRPAGRPAPGRLHRLRRSPRAGARSSGTARACSGTTSPGRRRPLGWPRCSRRTTGPCPTAW